jgi:hypothetical protein
VPLVALVVRFPVLPFAFPALPLYNRKFIHPTDSYKENDQLSCP